MASSLQHRIGLTEQISCRGVFIHLGVYVEVSLKACCRKEKVLTSIYSISGIVFKMELSCFARAPAARNYCSSTKAAVLRGARLSEFEKQPLTPASPNSSLFGPLLSLLSL